MNEIRQKPNYFVHFYFKEESEIRFTIDTELERNRFSLELFSQDKQGEIVLVWVEESDLKIWDNT